MSDQSDEERAPFTRRDELTAREVLANVIECQDATEGADDGEHVIAAALAAERERCRMACIEVACSLDPGLHPEGDGVAMLCVSAIRALGDNGD